MANIQSQIKRNRQNEKRRLRNRDSRGSARSAVRQALASMTPDQNSAAGVKAAIRALDKAARKGAIHPRNAARRKSRLLKRLATLGLQGQTASTAPEGALTAKIEAGGAKKVEAKPKKAAPKKTTKKTAAKTTK